MTETAVGTSACVDPLLKIYAEVTRGNLNEDGCLCGVERERDQTAIPATILITLECGIDAVKECCSENVFEQLLLRASDDSSFYPDLFEGEGIVWVARRWKIITKEMVRIRSALIIRRLLIALWDLYEDRKLVFDSLVQIGKPALPVISDALERSHAREEEAIANVGFGSFSDRARLQNGWKIYRQTLQRLLSKIN